MKTKIYLIVLMLVIMAGGARTMFEIAYRGMAGEHSATPDHETGMMIILALWFIVMMVCDVLLLSNKNLKGRPFYIVALTAGVILPMVFMYSRSGR